jgi:hypothetical protein
VATEAHLHQEEDPCRSRCLLGCSPDKEVEARLGLFILARVRTITTHLETCEYPVTAFYSRGLIQNSVAVSPQDIPPSRDGTDVLLLINDLFVFSARPLDGFPPGYMSMSDPQRTWANIGLRDSIKVQLYDPFSQGGQAYLGSADIEVSFASTKKRVEAPYDQDELAQAVIRVSLPHPSPEYMLTNLRTLRTSYSHLAREF